MCEKCGGTGVMTVDQKTIGDCDECNKGLTIDADIVAMEECECGSGEMTQAGGCCEHCFDAEDEDLDSVELSFQQEVLELEIRDMERELVKKRRELKELIGKIKEWEDNANETPSNHPLDTRRNRASYPLFLGRAD